MLRSERLFCAFFLCFLSACADKGPLDNPNGADFVVDAGPALRDADVDAVTEMDAAQPSPDMSITDAATRGDALSGARIRMVSTSLRLVQNTGRTLVLLVDIPSEAGIEVIEGAPLTLVLNNNEGGASIQPTNGMILSDENGEATFSVTAGQVDSEIWLVVTADDGTTASFRMTVTSS